MFADATSARENGLDTRATQTRQASEAMATAVEIDAGPRSMSRSLNSRPTPLVKATTAM